MDPYETEPSPADEVMDELMPAELDWQVMVEKYPLVALALAALGGFVLGRHHGADILQAFSRFAADTVTEQVNELLGQDVL
jgi:hypothetical protein